MTREEAIDKLEAFAPMVVDDTREALDVAIEALQREEHLVELEAKAVAIIKSERHGEWEVIIKTEDEMQARCSECKMVYFLGMGRNPNYCPNCGAKMDKK